MTALRQITCFSLRDLAHTSHPNYQTSDWTARKKMSEEIIRKIKLTTKARKENAESTKKERPKESEQ